MEDKILEKNIIIEAKYITNGLQDYIKEKLDELVNTCTKENGYIIKIKNIKNIKNNKILKNSGNLLCQILYNATVFKPYKNLETNCKVTMIFRHGIFGECNQMPVLIPYTKLNDYEYDNEKFKNKDIEIKVGDIITIIITDIRYSKKQFNCIASLKI
tara:strand:- start:3164 stop:3634 length:471 start_codon:yes stop_codon:yes gene_type:complete